MSFTKLEYFFNAVLYCLWLYKVGHNKNLFRIMTLIAKPISHGLLSKETSQKFDKKLEKGRKEHEKFVIDKKNGLAITTAENLLFYATYSYLLMISLIIWGVILGVSINPNPGYGFACLLISFAIYYIVTRKSLWANKKYLDYFKMFKKESEQWHKKWNRITLWFCLGGLVSLFLGASLGLCIAIWLTD